jgi:hypothetical protein
MRDIDVLVNQHNAAVRVVSERRKRYRSDCVICNSKKISPHELRRRTLRIIQGCNVVLRTLWLARWRCMDCRRVWTDYPSFRLAV